MRWSQYEPNANYQSYQPDLWKHYLAEFGAVGQLGRQGVGVDGSSILHGTDVLLGGQRRVPIIATREPQGPPKGMLLPTWMISNICVT